MKMKSYLYTAALVAALFVSVGLASSTASAPADARNTRESELVVSFDEAFTGDSTIDGETTLAGAYNDKGSRHYDFTIRQSGNIAQVSGTITITTSHGTLISEFAGQLSATNNPTFIEGVETLTGGTGIYAHAVGRGVFKASVDFETGKIVGIAQFNITSSALTR